MPAMWPGAVDAIDMPLVTLTGCAIASVALFDAPLPAVAPPVFFSAPASDAREIDVARLVARRVGVGDIRRQQFLPVGAHIERFAAEREFGIEFVQHSPVAP